MDVTIDVFGDACVAFGDDRPLRALGGKALHGAQHIRGPDAAIGTEGEWLVIKFFNHGDHGGTCHAHHRAASGVKAHRAAPRHIGEFEGLGGGDIFFGAEMVSSQSTSAPPSFRPSACS